MKRRRVLQGGAATVAWLLARGGRPAARPPSRLGFEAVPVSRADAVVVPPGYEARVIYAWGDPVSSGPPWDPRARNTGLEQEQQAGMDHDGMYFFPLPAGSATSDHGLLAVNHESTDEGLLHADGAEPWTAEKVRKAQAAVGVSVVEVRLRDGRWEVVRPSPFARRLHARSAMRLSGPAAGDRLLRTLADPGGRDVLGTFANCASGLTPWGTYLTCEENFTDFFGSSTGAVPEPLARYGVQAPSRAYRWFHHDPRFDVSREPHEANRHGYVTEIDPYDPSSMPVKRTALGRFKHETATLTLAPDGRVVVYMGDDAAFECIYKFVSREPWTAGRRGELLDDGTLYVAHFGAKGRGEWRPLVHGTKDLRVADGFANQADVLVHARQAAAAVGGTPMDRPEWLAIHPDTGEVYCTLTNNVLRGLPDRPRVDEANPRSPNLFGHILRWREDDGDAAAARFRYDVFVLAGPEAGDRSSVPVDAFACPDGLGFDPGGLLWIQTDVSSRAAVNPAFQALGNNMMLAADPATGEVRRFLTGPPGAEIAGLAFTPDLRTLFVNIQHPGEPIGARSDPHAPGAVSTWPDGPKVGRPRSATLAIRRTDGGLIGR